MCPILFGLSLHVSKDDACDVEAKQQPDVGDKAAKQRECLCATNRLPARLFSLSVE